MAIRVVCEKCGQGYNVEAALAGKKVRCRHCQHVMTVSAPASPAAAETRIEPALSPSDTGVVPALDAPQPGGGRGGPMPLAPPTPVPLTPTFSRPELLERAPRRSRVLAGGSDVAGKVMQVLYANMGKLLLLVLAAAIGLGVYFGKDRLKGKIVHPPLPALAEIEPGVLRAKVTLKRDGWVPDPAMDVWVYLPAGKHANASLPCILIAGAGSNLITGMKLSAGDDAEHLPYVRAGFAVVAYDVDGMLKNRERPTEAEFRTAIREFIRAEGGVANARKAIDYLLDRVPQIDPKKLYAAGHSSAGTLALQVASREPRIAGCAAYAPAVDVEAFVRSFDEEGWLDSADRAVGGLKKYMRDYSPSNNVDRINCPVLLFVADDDEAAPQVQAFATRKPGQFKLVTVRSGGHHDSMIRDGIPAGIAFLGNMAGLAPQAVARGGNAVPAPPSNTNAWSGWRNEGAQSPPPDAVVPPPPPGDQAVPPPVNPVMPPPPPETAVAPPVPAVVTPPGPAIPEPPVLTGEQQAITQLQRLGVFVAMRNDAVESIDLSQALDVDKAIELLPKLGKASVVRISSACLTPKRVEMLGKAPGLRRIEAEAASISDAQLKALGTLTDLQELSLSANPITDAGLVHLKGMAGLTRLYLKDTKITSAGLIHLNGLTSLHILDLSQTRVADAGLVHLKGLKGLIGLLVRNTDVTENGKAELKKSLPKANIVGP